MTSLHYLLYGISDISLPVNHSRRVALTSTRSPTSMAMTKTTTTKVYPVRTQHQLRSQLSSLPLSPVFNSDKSAGGNVRPAPHCEVASEGLRNARLYPQRQYTSHAHLPSVHLSSTATTTSSPRTPKTRSSNPLSRPSRPLLPSPLPPPPSRRQPHRPPQSPLPQPPHPRTPALAAPADSCRYARRSVDVPRKTRKRRVSSGSFPANRNVLPRQEQPEVGMKAQNVFGYDLARPAWPRRHLRCPPRHAQDQALRTETRVRRGWRPLLMTTAVHNRALNVSVCTSRAYFF